MLTLTFLGVGSAFAKRNFQSNALVEAWSKGPEDQAVPDETLLIDFGTTGPCALHALKDKPGFEYLNHEGRIDYRVINNVFLTHQHSDHFGGLEELAIVNLLQRGALADPTVERPRLIGAERLLSNLWEHSLRGGLGIVDGRLAEFADYFRVEALSSSSAETNESDPDRRDLEPEGFTFSERYRFQPFRTNHIYLGQPFDWPSYSLLITDPRTGGTVFYSGDTRFDRERFGPMMTGARLNFHDVQLEPDPDPSPVHSLLSELRTLPEDVRKKTLLYHYGDTWDCGAYDSVAKEFAGFAQPQQRYTLFA